MKTINKLFLVLFIGILISGILSGCTTPLLTSQKDEKKSQKNKESSQIDEENINNVSDDASSINKSLMTRYIGGRQYACTAARVYGLETEYYLWRAHYVTPDGCPTGTKRVQRDNASDLDTVSEGIGYGMLLAVYMNDQTTFDKLFNYCKAHFVSSTIKLMHWKVDADGNNVSEFADYAKERITRKILVTPAGGGIGSIYEFTPIRQATVPHGHVFFRISTGKVVILPTRTELNNLHAGFYDAVYNYYNNSSSYYLAATNDRMPGSATDADVDITAALCFAHRKWGSTGTINYSQEATNMLTAIKNNDFIGGGFIKNGSSWGGQTGWNPSYVTPAYYNKIFYQHCTAQADKDFWNTVNTRMKQEMDKFKNNSSCKLWPDWCKTTGSTITKSTISDRQYLIGEWSDGTPIYGKLMSYNFYYDAVRVPWRMAVATSWGQNTTETYNIAKALAFFENIGIENVMDGYSIIGGSWRWNDRDGFNEATGGVNHSTTFVAMIATLGMHSTDDEFAEKCFEEVRDTKDRYSDDHNYYGNTLRLLSLLYLSGKFVNLYQQ